MASDGRQCAIRIISLVGHYFTWRLWQAIKQGWQLRTVCLLTAC